MRQLLLFSLLPVFIMTGSSVLAAEAPILPSTYSLEIVPAKVPAKCEVAPERAQLLFDVCADQLQLLREALLLAERSGKSVLVSYGADWCIWCHVFEAHLLGGYGEFTHFTPDGPWTMLEKGDKDLKSQAEALSRFAAANFVVVNIAQQSENTGEAALRETKAEDEFSGGLPFIYVLDRNGQFAGVIKSFDVEIRRDGRKPYRGYDRSKLLAVLQSLRAKRLSD